MYDDDAWAAMMKRKLDKVAPCKPCPHCGSGLAMDDGDRDGCWVMCKSCYATGPHADNELKAREKWNERRK